MCYEGVHGEGVHTSIKVFTYEKNDFLERAVQW
jgi:hypothetical protein